LASAGAFAAFAYAQPAATSTAPRLVSVHAQREVSVGRDQEVTVTTLAIGAGNWLFSANGTIENPNGLRMAVSCGIGDGALKFSPNQQYAYTSFTLEPGARVPLTLSGEARLSAISNVTLRCRAGWPQFIALPSASEALPPNPATARWVTMIGLEVRP
jgi:hypothetical protein